jgi:hypothetical protein
VVVSIDAGKVREKLGQHANAVRGHIESPDER